MTRPEFYFGAALFAAAVALVGGLLIRGVPAPANSPWLLLFFLLFGLFTIGVGYEHPRVGHVSFDRVAQMASILVLGHVAAAAINGLASLLFPFSRLVRGQSLDRVLGASLNNSGLMALAIIGSGSLYQWVGGRIPLTQLDLTAAVSLPLLLLGMQALNELGMTVHTRLRHGSWPLHLSKFVLALEIGSGLAAVLVAIIFNRMEPAVGGLLLLVLGAGMLALRQFARMRIQLEALVADRTRVLEEKTLELERLATRDQLTGLFNRRYADTYLEQRIDEYYRYGRGFALALVDIDHFKRINDQQSHEIGDAVLQRFARLLTDRCRETDMVARYGGEEFLLCFPEADRSAAAHICEKLRQAVETLDWSGLATDLRVSFSGGVAEMQPGLNRSSLVNQADRKLYEAKSAGRNLVLS